MTKITYKEVPICRIGGKFDFEEDAITRAKRDIQKRIDENRRRFERRIFGKAARKPTDAP